jgi:hypothetical protein
MVTVATLLTALDEHHAADANGSEWSVLRRPHEQRRRRRAAGRSPDAPVTPARATRPNSHA